MRAQFKNQSLSYIKNQQNHDHFSINVNASSLDFTFISCRTSSWKLKLIRICMRNNNTVIQLQCSSVLGDYIYITHVQSLALIKNMKVESQVTSLALTKKKKMKIALYS